MNDGERAVAAGDRKDEDGAELCRALIRRRQLRPGQAKGRLPAPAGQGADMFFRILP